jgi:hypothetical protein
MNSDIINASQPAKRKRSGGGRAFHSRLESFANFIRDERQRRMTWKEIAAALSGEKNCAITAQGVHQFYRRYLQRRAQPHGENAVAPAAATNIPPAVPTAPGHKPVLAVTPPPRETRRPNPEDLKLNDPTTV